MKIETTLEEMRKSYDWTHVFEYSQKPTQQPEGIASHGFGLEHVVEVLASVEGENDGPRWAAVVRLQDKRFGYVEAGCDYSGWECQADGAAAVAKTLHRLMKFGVTPAMRERFEYTIVPSSARHLKIVKDD